MNANRIRDHLTWPDDIAERRERARLDIDFVNAIGACDIYLPMTMLGLRVCAHQVLLELAELTGDE